MISKMFNIESLFPDDTTKPNIGELFLSFIIVMSVVCLILETEKTIYVKNKAIFKTLDYIFFFIFSVEYILRLVFCGKILKYKGFRGKLRYIISPIAIGGLSELRASAPIYFYYAMRAANTEQLLRANPNEFGFLPASILRFPHFHTSYYIL